MNEQAIDQALVKRAQEGDVGAFELLVDKYQRRLTRLLSRLIKDEQEILDIAQETFIKAYQALPDFRGESAFYTWLCRIGINTAKNYLVTRSRQPLPESDLGGDDEDELSLIEQLPDWQTPETALLNREIMQTVQAAIEKLPEELRQTILLREMEGLPYEQIAEILDCPVGTVRSRLFRAREAVAQALRPILDTAEDKRW